MNEFRKPYEYTEEKNGPIILFVIMLIAVDILLALFYIVLVHNILKQTPVLSNGFMVIGILYMLFILFTAVTCYKLKKNMLTIAKAYLVVRAAFSTCGIFVIFLHNISDKNIVGPGKQYSTIFSLLLALLIIPLGYVLIVSIGWYLYFLKSKKCRDLVMKSTD